MTHDEALLTSTTGAAQCHMGGLIMLSMPRDWATSQAADVGERTYWLVHPTDSTSSYPSRDSITLSLLRSDWHPVMDRASSDYTATGDTVSR